MKQMQWRMDSRIGPVYLAASEKGLQKVSLKKQGGSVTTSPMAKSLAGAGPETRILVKAASQLKEFLDGKRKKFDLPLDAKGTVFQKRVWNTLQKIPYGQTCSYQDIARRIKNPKAVRAVGSANGANPLCIVVPCHRVIGADGSIGGYSGGLKLKRELLGLERKG